MAINMVTSIAEIPHREHGGEVMQPLEELGDAHD